MQQIDKVKELIEKDWEIWREILWSVPKFSVFKKIFEMAFIEIAQEKSKARHRSALARFLRMNRTTLVETFSRLGFDRNTFFAYTLDEDEK